MNVIDQDAQLCGEVYRLRQSNARRFWTILVLGALLMWRMLEAL